MQILSTLFEIIQKGVQDGIFPGAVIGVSYENRRYIVGGGYRAFTPFIEPMEEDNIFDLASLTKPLALAFTFMFLLQKDPKIDLQAPIGEYLPLKKDLAGIPIFRFLNHTSGLKDWYPFYKDILKEENSYKLKNLIEILQDLPLEYTPGTKSLYSDLGYFLLTYLLESVYKKDLEELFKEAKRIIPFSKRAFLDFRPLKKGVDQEKVVPTSVCPWSKKILRGIVEDENTRALGGVSGVAGLFGNIYGVLDALEFLVASYKGEIRDLSPNIVSQFVDHREDISEYALGFMLPNEKEKVLLKDKVSSHTIRHTGFTGCSFFMDLEKGLIIVLLSNRVHPDRSNTKIREFRPWFHKKVIEILI